MADSVGTVLVAVLERHVLRLIKVNLIRQGYRVLTALDPDSAIELLQRESISLLVLDPALPRAVDVKAAADAIPVKELGAASKL